MSSTYQVCTRCVMDTTDPEIQFDANGVCSHCHFFDAEIRKRWHPNEQGHEQLSQLVARVREAGRGQEYDCILGVSGGVDSSYLTLKVKELGLRPLVMHVDAGWNSELAVNNIEKIVKHCGFELHTHVMDWDEMRDLQLAYLRSGVSNQDVPQDHAFFANLYHYAIKNDIKTILSGGNAATEAIFPSTWHGNAMDEVNLRAIHREFGKYPLRHYSTISFWQYYIWYPLVKGMRTLRPLDYMAYDRQAAIEELQRIGWRSYGRKHGESLFTKFFQNYYLPEKFGFDKRRPHLSSMILSGQLSREEAVVSLEEPLYTPSELEVDLNYFCKKLGITRTEFEAIMAQPAGHYQDFPNWDRRFRLLKATQRFVERIIGRPWKVYS